MEDKRNKNSEDTRKKNNKESGRKTYSTTQQHTLTVSKIMECWGQDKYTDQWKSVVRNMPLWQIL